MTKDEERAIIAQRNALLAQARAIEAPLEAERKARYAAEAAERFRLATEAHDRAFGSMVGKVVASVNIKLSDEDAVEIQFADGSTLHLEYESGYYAGDAGRIDVDYR